MLCMRRCHQHHARRRERVRVRGVVRTRRATHAREHRRCDALRPSAADRGARDTGALVRSCSATSGATCSEACRNAAAGTRGAATHAGIYRTRDEQRTSAGGACSRSHGAFLGRADIAVVRAAGFHVAEIGCTSSDGRTRSATTSGGAPIHATRRTARAAAVP